MFELFFTETARTEFQRLESSPTNEGLVKQIKQSLSLLQHNPQHPSLRIHAYTSIEHPYHPQEKVFEIYAQHDTPLAFRMFWCYGPEHHQITIISILPSL